MTDHHSLLKLLSWLSPAFPTGAFSYSHGLEAAVSDGLVTNNETLEAWLNALLTKGPGWNDAIFLAEGWRSFASPEKISELADLALALTGTKERHLETTAQGSAFAKAATAWNEPACRLLPQDCPLPLAIGVLAGAEEINLDAALTAYLHAYVSNQIQAALRLMPLGQTNALTILKALERTISKTALRASCATLDDLGSATFNADIASMRHETLQSRIFRS